MANILLLIIAMCLLVVAIRDFVSLLHYFSFRDYDKQYGTEYRFRQGKEHAYPFVMPRWMEFCLRKWEA